MMPPNILQTQGIYSVKPASDKSKSEGDIASDLFPDGNPMGPTPDELSIEAQENEREDENPLDSEELASEFTPFGRGIDPYAESEPSPQDLRQTNLEDFTASSKRRKPKAGGTFTIGRTGPLGPTELESPDEAFFGPQVPGRVNVRGRAHQAKVGIKSAAKGTTEAARMRVASVQANRAERKGKEAQFWETLSKGQENLPPSLQKSFRKSQKKGFESSQKVRQEAAELGIPSSARQIIRDRGGRPVSEGDLQPKSTAVLQREILLHKQFVQERKEETEKVKPFTKRKTVRIAAKVGGKAAIGIGKNLPKLSSTRPKRRTRAVAPQASRIQPFGVRGGRISVTGKKIPLI